MSVILSAMGRVLGVDYGRKRVGLAISDSSRKVALPHGVVKREKFMEEVEKLIREKGVDTVVFGLPMSLSGKELEMAGEIREVARRIKEKFGVKVILKDERFTSKLVEEKFGRDGPIDHYSAGIILQEYLDFGTGQEME